MKGRGLTLMASDLPRRKGHPGPGPWFWLLLGTQALRPEDLPPWPWAQLCSGLAASHGAITGLQLDEQGAAFVLLPEGKWFLYSTFAG